MSSYKNYCSTTGSSSSSGGGASSWRSAASNNNPALGGASSRYSSSSNYTSSPSSSSAGKSYNSSTLSNYSSSSYSTTFKDTSSKFNTSAHGGPQSKGMPGTPESSSTSLTSSSRFLNGRLDKSTNSTLLNKQGGRGGAGADSYSAREHSNLSSKAPAMEPIREKLSTKLTDSPIAASRGSTTTTNNNNFESTKKSTNNSSTVNQVYQSTLRSCAAAATPSSSCSSSTNPLSLRSHRFGIRDTTRYQTYQFASPSNPCPNFSQINTKSDNVATILKKRNDDSVVELSWMSRGTSPMTQPAASPSSDSNNKSISSTSQISLDEIPAISPKKFTGVLKSKCTQTDKEKLFLQPVPKLGLSSSLATSKYLSSIPRPTSAGAKNLSSDVNNSKSTAMNKTQLNKISSGSSINSGLDNCGNTGGGIIKNGSITKRPPIDPSTPPSPVHPQPGAFSHLSRPINRTAKSCSPNHSPVKTVNKTPTPVLNRKDSTGGGSGGLPVRKPSIGSGMNKSLANSTSSLNKSRLSVSRNDSTEAESSSNKLANEISSISSPQNSSSAVSVSQSPSIKQVNQHQQSSKRDSDTWWMKKHDEQREELCAPGTANAEEQIAIVTLPLPHPIAARPLAAAPPPPVNSNSSVTLHSTTAILPNREQEDDNTIDYWSNMNNNEPNDEDTQIDYWSNMNEQPNDKDTQIDYWSTMNQQHDADTQKQNDDFNVSFTLKKPENKFWLKNTNSTTYFPSPSMQALITQISSDDDDDTSSSSSSVSINNHNVQEECDGLEEEDDDVRSTGTSSSFEEMNLNGLDEYKFDMDANERSSAISGGGNEQGVKVEVESTVEPPSQKVTRPKMVQYSNRMIPVPKNLTLDDATLQLYNSESEYSIANGQGQEDDEFSTIKVNSIIEKLLTTSGSELHGALISLKQIFQADSLINEFIQNDGLSCLIKIGSEVDDDDDETYQNYILRALGQLMLYKHGMYGIMHHNKTIQWFYSLINSKYYQIKKIVLKILIVFVDYIESNCLLLIEAMQVVDSRKGYNSWSNIMNLLRTQNSMELLVYGITLINKVLSSIPNLDTYYDQIDSLEEHGIGEIIRKYTYDKQTEMNADFIQQLQIYDIMLKYEEDGDQSEFIKLDESMRQKLENRNRCSSQLSNGRKSRRRRRRYSTLKNNGDDNFASSRYPELSRTVEDLTQIYPSSTAEDSGFESSTVSISNPSWRPEQPESTEKELQIIHESTRSAIKDLARKLSQSLPLEELNHKPSPTGDLTGIITKAKEELIKSRVVEKNSVVENGIASNANETQEQELSENELQWNFLKSNLKRPLEICDLNFNDLSADDDVSSGFGPPPPPRPPPPPPFFLNNNLACHNPPPAPFAKFPPIPPPPTPQSTTKTKKTIKLFWKEIRHDSLISADNSVWNELQPISVDTVKLEFLFESKAKDMINKKQQDLITKFKEIVVLDPKRSNAINIGMTKLPHPRTIKTAILKMDSTIINREGIEKLLTMLPTDEERLKIQEAQYSNPEIPLGNAENFLLILSSISELPARLKLWAFKLDYENLEKEIAEPLMDLKLGLELLQKNKTFKYILSTLLSIGNFLNGINAKGFQIDYLAKLPEVKDTVHKHSLLHHLCCHVIEKFHDSTDLYSEIGPVTRASRVDFDELAGNLSKMETDCKISWDYLRIISKYDGPTNMKLKMSEFLADTAERIIVLQIIHRRVLIRFHKFLLWLGLSTLQITTTKPHSLFKIISEFALEYRTTRERVVQERQELEKKVNHRERNKMKLITEETISNGSVYNNLPQNTKEHKTDLELRQVLNSTSPAASTDRSAAAAAPGRKFSPHPMIKYTGSRTTSHIFSFDHDNDEILESLVKNATPGTRTVQRKSRVNGRFGAAAAAAGADRKL